VVVFFSWHLRPSHLTLGALSAWLLVHDRRLVRIDLISGVVFGMNLDPFVDVLSGFMQGCHHVSLFMGHGPVGSLYCIWFDCLGSCGCVVLCRGLFALLLGLPTGIFIVSRFVSGTVCFYPCQLLCRTVRELHTAFSADILIKRHCANECATNTNKRNSTGMRVERADHHPPCCLSCSRLSP
jgi:hypothetical protein